MTGPVDISNFSKNSPEITEDLDRRRSSACATMSQFLCDAVASTGVALTSGSAYGGLAYNKVSQPYTAIRFCTAATAPSAVTQLVLGVTDLNGNVLASTADISASVTAASTLLDNVPLTAPITLGLGQAVYLGIAWVGTTLTVEGLGLRNSGMTKLAQMAQPLVRSGSGFTVAPLPALPNLGLTTIIPWIELIP